MQARFFALTSLVVLVSSCGSQPADSEPVSVTPVARAANLPAMESARIVDLTVLISETLPAHWGANAPFARWTNNWFEVPANDYGTPSAPSVGPYYSQRYVIDEHTGTQTDFPSSSLRPIVGFALTQRP